MSGVAIFSARTDGRSASRTPGQPLFIGEETHVTRRIFSTLAVTFCVAVAATASALAQPEILLLQQQHVWQVERDHRAEIAQQQERIHEELLRDLQATGRDDAAPGSQMTCLPACMWLCSEFSYISRNMKPNS